MSASIFVDTNVLVYAYDRSIPAKQAQARQVMNHLVTHRVGVISTQVLAEFFVIATRKIATPLSVKQGYSRIRNFLQIWTVVDVTGPIVLEAARGVRDHGFSFWDAQIWATARLNQIPLIFTEDFAADTVTEGVRTVNPFAVDFQLDEWV